MLIGFLTVKIDMVKDKHIRYAFFNSRMVSFFRIVIRMSSLDVSCPDSHLFNEIIRLQDRSVFTVSHNPVDRILFGARDSDSYAAASVLRRLDPDLFSERIDHVPDDALINVKEHFNGLPGTHVTMFHDVIFRVVHSFAPCRRVRIGLIQDTEVSDHVDPVALDRVRAEFTAKKIVIAVSDDDVVRAGHDRLFARVVELLVNAVLVVVKGDLAAQKDGLSDLAEIQKERLVERHVLLVDSDIELKHITVSVTAQ